MYAHVPTVSELVDGGDWAAGHGDGEALADVATRLAEDPRIDPGAAAIARRIAADCAAGDVESATLAWSRLAEDLRAAAGVRPLARMERRLERAIERAIERAEDRLAWLDAFADLRARRGPRRGAGPHA